MNKSREKFVWNSGLRARKIRHFHKGKNNNWSAEQGPLLRPINQNTARYFRSGACTFSAGFFGDTSGLVLFLRFTSTFCCFFIGTIVKGLKWVSCGVVCPPTCVRAGFVPDRVALYRLLEQQSFILFKLSCYFFVHLNITHIFFKQQIDFLFN